MQPSSLNPCFSGRYAGSRKLSSPRSRKKSLNPCFSGRYAGSFAKKNYKEAGLSLNPCFSGRYAGRFLIFAAILSQKEVLILVFREDMLGE